MLNPAIVRSGGDVLKSERFGLQIVRVIFGFVATTSLFYSVAHLPLAEASAISFSRVIFVVGLAAIIFADRVGFIGWGATAIGLAGVAVMLDPAAEALNQAALVGAVGAFPQACGVIAVKKLTATDATATIMCYPPIGLTLLCIIPSILDWQPITWEAAPMFILIMVSSIISNWCFINAYRHGEASIMGTVEYSRLVTAALVGFVFFHEVPTLDALVGIALIVAAFVTNLILGQFHPGFGGQPIAHTMHIWNFAGMVLAGLAFALAGGCPGRQLFLSGEGDGDAAVFVLGMIVGAGFAHNFGLASSPKGVGPYGIPAVIIGIVVCLFIGFTMRKRSTP